MADVRTEALPLPPGSIDFNKLQDALAAGHEDPVGQAFVDTRPAPEPDPAPAPKKMPTAAPAPAAPEPDQAGA
jgi:hypothetical protein